MKIEQIDNEKIDKKIHKITISNHGNEYEIVSDFHGIRIKKNKDTLMGNKLFNIFPTGDLDIVIK